MINSPIFRLCEAPLPYTDSYKYLGHIINSNLSDDADIMKQTRSLYARANMIIRKFSAASLSTKLMLFRAYCTPIYGCQLWCSMFQYSWSKLRIAYNDAFRHLLHEPRWCSASSLFVSHNVVTFTALVRKLVHTFWRSLQNSSNTLISSAMNSDLRIRSLLLKKWQSILF